MVKERKFNEEAVSAFNAALAVRNRERAPLDWAVTQMNLGEAVMTLAEKSRNSVMVDDAILHCRAALEVFRGVNHTPNIEHVSTHLEKANALRREFQFNQS